MPLMPIITRTIKALRCEITVFSVNSAILILVYNLYMDSVIILYPLLLSAAVLLIYFVIKGISLVNLYKRLENARTVPDDYVGDNELQVHIFEVISAIHRKYLGQISRLNTQMNTRNALFSQFVHSMKSSVAVIELACEKFSDELPGPLISDIIIENEKLRKNLEQTLNLLRLDAFTNDYIPERVDLAAIVTRAINEHKRDFIYAGVFPKLNGTAFVNTDSKWCGFIISQLILNAVKYSNPGDTITFNIETFGKRTELRITDSGIGIPPEDLPRVFDMFFTGANGRQRKESTGIGLFMVKHIAGRLGVAVSIYSEIGKGTSVTLVFRSLTKM